MDAKQDLQAEKFVRIATQCLCANSRRAARVITHIYDEFLQPSGLLTTQFILLSALAMQPAIALTPLADLLGMDATTLARNLKPLEKSGLIQILAGADRRKRMVSLTDAGKDIVVKTVPLWEQAQAWVIERIGTDRWQRMLGDWSTLVDVTRA